MTSAKKGEGGPKMHLIFGLTVYIFRSAREMGVKKVQNSVDVIYGSPTALCSHAVIDDGFVV